MPPTVSSDPIAGLAAGMDLDAGAGRAAPRPLDVRLFGGFAATVRGAPMRKLRTRQGSRLLALLALNGGRELDRATLSARLWQETTDKGALALLRRTLTDLRDALGAEASRLESVGKFALRLDLTSGGAACDVDEFDRALATGTLEGLDRAIDLYRGPIMPDLDAAADSEETLRVARDRTLHAFLEAVERRALQRQEAAQFPEAAADYRRVLAADPTRESASRHLMELLANADRAGAMAEYVRLRRALSRDLGAKPAHATRSLYERIRLNGLGKSGRPAEVRSSVVADVVHPSSHNLPTRLTRFIGREAAVSAVRGLLREKRLLTLTGTGGAGKTRLAQQSARTLLDDFPDGAWQVELAALTDPSLVARAVATALGVKESAGQSVSDALVQHLAAKRLLLLLDNCEHVLDASATLAAALLEGCPAVHLLATSREPLGVLGEQSYRVPPLTMPDISKPGAILTADIESYEAVRLFADRAALARSDFVLNNSNASAVARLCQRLDGIPLALELAATRTRSMPLEKIVENLEDRFSLLTVGNRAALPRHQTLRALVDWSYDLLTSSEKRLFARVSVFMGGWTSEAAESVCAAEADAPDDPLPESDDVLELLANLVDKSLVLVDEQEDGSIRYRMLETLRQYASEKLTGSGEISRTQRRHQDWCVAFAALAQPQLSGPQQALWLNRLEIEHDNLRAALSVDAGETDMSQVQLDHDPRLRLSGSLWYFWYIRGHFTEGRERLTHAIDNARRLKVMQGRDGARALNGRGNLALTQGDYAVSRASYEEALGYYREWNDQRAAAQVLSNLGILAQYEGDLTSAHRLYTESCEIFRELGDRIELAYSLSSLGGSAQMSGDLISARSLLEESLSILRELGDSRGIAIVVTNLGGVARAQGDLAAARALREEGLALFRESGDRDGIVGAQINLGVVVQKQGDNAAARSMYRDALALCRDLGDRRRAAYVLECLGSVALAEGDALRFVTLAAAADTMREQLGAPAVDPSEREDWPENLSRARTSLGEGGFASAWSKGSALSWDRAAAFALNE